MTVRVSAAPEVRDPRLDRFNACLIKGGSRSDLLREARRDGMLTLDEAALRQALLGVIPIEEAVRVFRDLEYGPSASPE